MSSSSGAQNKTSHTRIIVPADLPTRRECNGGLLERDGHVYTKVVEHVLADTLMAHIQTTTRKGSVYYTDAFRGYQSLRRYGKHHMVNHSKSLVDRRTKNPINGIEGFWSFAKHILYNYRGVSKYHFPMYLNLSIASTTAKKTFLSSSCGASLVTFRPNYQKNIW